MIFTVLRPEEKLVDLAPIPNTVIRKGRLDGEQTVRTEIRALTPVPDDGWLLHIAVPGLLLGDDGVDALISLFIEFVELVQLRISAHHHAGGVRQGLSDLPRPLLGHMGGAQDHIEGLLSAPASLFSVKSVHGGHGRRANLRFSTSTFRHDEAALVLLQLALHRLRHSKLGVVKGIPSVGSNVVVDRQNLR